jgi:hypothetical protein
MPDIQVNISILLLAMGILTYVKYVSVNSLHMISPV